MFCNQCGSENRNDRKFCSNCGAPLRDYTKPRENLIMPEEIDEKQQAVQSKNKINLIMNIVIWSVFVVAIIFMVVAFVTQYKFIFSLLAIVFCVITLILMIVAKALEHKKNKIISGDTKKEKE